MKHDNNCIQAMDVVNAFGAHWPMSGRDLDDLPAFAKEMVEGIEEHAKEEALKEVAAEVEKRRSPHQQVSEYYSGYNKALDDVLEALTKKI